MRTILQDMRYGARMLAKSPGATAVALVTLALGIGVNTATFSVVNAFENIPKRLTEPEQLVFLYQTTERYSQAPVCPFDFRDWREQAESFADIALHASRSFTLTGQGEPEQVRGEVATSNLLPMLGLRARLGRLYTEEEDSPASERVVVLG